jgi:hypothetical protein
VNAVEKRRAMLRKRFLTIVLAMAVLAFVVLWVRSALAPACDEPGAALKNPKCIEAP